MTNQPLRRTNLPVAHLHKNKFVPLGLMKHFRSACAALLLVACSPEGSKSDLLTGTWTCQSATVDGRALPEATIKLLRLTLTRDRFKTEKGKEVLFDSTYTVDAAKSPKQINMLGTEGELAGKESPGLYVLEGDTLRMCYTMPGKPRPAAFDSPAGSGVYLLVWKRAKP